MGPTSSSLDHWSQPHRRHAASFGERSHRPFLSSSGFTNRPLTLLLSQEPHWSHQQPSCLLSTLEQCRHRGARPPSHRLAASCHCHPGDLPQHIRYTPPVLSTKVTSEFVPCQAFTGCTRAAQRARPHHSGACSGRVLTTCRGPA
jgi:hypothetical protein